MFEILKDPQATCPELAKAYLLASAAEKSLKTEHDHFYEALLDIQKDCLDSSKEKKQVKDAQTAFERAKIRHSACLHGLKQIKDRLVERLPIEATARQQAIEAETETLQARKRELQKEFCKAVAKVQVILNKILGEPLTCTPAGHWVPGPLRDINFVTMDADDRLFIKQIIAKDAGKEPGLNLLLSRLGDESEKLKKLLAEPDMADQNPPSIVEKIEAEVGRLIGLSA